MFFCVSPILQVGYYRNGASPRSQEQRIVKRLTEGLAIKNFNYEDTQIQKRKVTRQFGRWGRSDNKYMLVET